MEERRRMQRFTLRLPCLIYDWNGTRGELLLKTRTRNVGIGGAYIDSSLPLPTGMRVGFALLIQPAGPRADFSQSSCVSLTARVLRTGEKGMGMAFDDAYRIMPAAHLADQCRAVSQWLVQWAPEPGNSTLGEKRSGPVHETSKVALFDALSTLSGEGHQKSE